MQHGYAADWINVNDDFKLLRFDALPERRLQPSGATLSGAQVVGYTTTVLPAAAGAGAELQLDLYWRATRQPSANYSLAVHLLDGAGNVYASTLAPPAEGHLPMLSWAAGDQFHTTSRLPLQPWTAPGDYRLQLQLFDSANQTYASVLGPGASGTSLLLPLQLALPAPGAARLPARTTVLADQFAGVGTLTGYQLAVDGREVAVTLYWQSTTRPNAAYTVFVHALDGSGRVLATGDAAPAAGAAPTASWQPKELVRDPHHLTLPAGVSAAAYEVGLYDPTSGDRVAVTLADGRQPTDRAVRLPPAG